MPEDQTDLLLVTPDHADDHDHDHAEDDFTHLGLAADTNMMTRSVMDRRRLLGLGALGVSTLLGAAALGSRASAALLGGGGAPPPPPAGRTPPGGPGGPGGPGMPPGQGDADTVTSADGQCTTLPQETQGPYPADGSGASGKTVMILDNTGIVRRDLTHSTGTGRQVSGVPLRLTMQLVDVTGNCTPLAGQVVYVWHCTAAGEYSLYSQGITAEDYLRGVQVTDAQGRVTFDTIFPGCYTGRWPHIHFEIYPNLAAAVKGNVDKNVSLVSQIALPEKECRAVYADKRYSGSVRNLNDITLATDNVFGDGAKAQTPRITGDAKVGYAASITVGVKTR